MSQTTLVVSSKRHHPLVRAALPSLAVLRRRCRRLRLSADDLATCATFGDVQRLAKMAHRRLSVRYHPDARMRCYHHTPITGDTFRKVQRTYVWLCAFPRNAALPQEQELPQLRYPWPPIAEADAPWERWRDETLPYGWQMA